MESGDNKIIDKLTEAKKICAALQSQDRKVRRQTYANLEKLLNQDFSDQDLREIFTETHMHFLNGLRDKSEAVREEAIKFVHFVIVQRYPLNDFYLTYVFPVLIERIGSVELIEESEEIRLKLLDLLNNILVKYANTDQLKPFLNDSVVILCESLKDKHPTIKELSCQTVIQLSKSLPRDFHMQAETLLKPVLGCFSHQRNKVRVAAIKAVGEIIMHSSYKGVDEAVGPMAEKLFDQIPAVRQVVAQVAAQWLLQHRDRYSYFHKMLPLLLTGLNDEVESTRIEAHLLWNQVGEQYLKENEKDLKDKMDYLYETPEYYPKHLTRPNLGCRVLVQRNISKLAGAISNELMSWQEDVRVRCSQLLCSLALHAEEDLTFNLQSLLPAMYSAARDDDKRVVDNIVQATKIIGHFVSYETWSKLIYPVIENEPHFGHLTVLAGLVIGAPSPNVAALVAVSHRLAEDRIAFCRKKKYQIALLECVRALENHYKKPKEDKLTGLEYNLFKIITILIALRHPDNEDLLNFELFGELSKAMFLNEAEHLPAFSNQLLSHINQAPKLWTVVNDYACTFVTLITYSGCDFSKNLDIIGDILSEVLDTEADAELRLKIFYVLADRFSRCNSTFNNADVDSVTVFLEKLIEDVFVPSLVWHAGATAEAIRTMAVTCLKYTLALIGQLRLLISADRLEQIMQKLLPLLLSLLEDASYRSRHMAIECLSVLKQNCVKQNVWWIDDFLKIYPELLKRLDDPTEIVRLSALDNLAKLFEKVPDEFLQPNFKAHRDYIIDTLMTHFDDDEESVQNGAMNVLKVVGKMNSSEMFKKIEIHRPLLRNQEGCEELIGSLQ